MANPIVEKIMADFETKIDLVTTGNGFEYTLTAQRHRPGPGNTVADGLVVIMMGEEEEADAPMQRVGRFRHFVLVIYALRHESDATEIQTKAFKMAADIEKKLMEDHTRDSNAVDTIPEPAELMDDTESNIAAVMLPIGVHYRYDFTDPYSQT